MAVFVITESTKVADLKEQFLKEFGGGLRVYDGTKRVEDDVLLTSLGAKTGHLECRASRTVGGFSKAFQSELNLKVKVWTVDYNVEVLEGITLATVKDLPKVARKADLEKFIGYQRSEGGEQAEAFEIPEEFKDRVVFVIDFSEAVSEEIVREKIELYNELRNKDDYEAAETLAEKYPWLEPDFGAVVACQETDDSGYEDAYSVAYVGDRDDSTEYCLSEAQYERERNYGGDLPPYTFRFSTKVEVYNCPDQSAWEFTSEIDYILQYVYGTRRLYKGDRDDWSIGDAMLFLRRDDKADYSVYEVVDAQEDWWGGYSVAETQRILATLPKSKS